MMFYSELLKVNDQNDTKIGLSRMTLYQSRKVIIVVINFALAINPAHAEYWCKAIALRNTHYNDHPEIIIKKDTEDTFTSDYGNDLCQHGGYCVKRQDFKLIDCDYHLNPIRSKAEPIALRYSDVSDTLVNMGLCSLCAKNAASWYIKHPLSKTGKLVKAALEGNPEAKKKLIEDTPQFLY